MPSYAPPTRDMEFLLHVVMNLTQSPIPGYGDLDRDTTRAIFEEGGRFGAEVFQPLNATGDREGCRLEAGRVHTPPGFAEAFEQLRNAGWPALGFDEAYGGQGLPHVMSTALGEIFAASNMALSMYHGLTQGACSTIHAHGTEAQKAFWLPKMVSCDWTGTMDLTEPQAGTDLGLLRSRAEPQADGSYKITGTKIFISAGDHDLAENIIHLVLARIPGGPEGVKGISLFIVPKVLVEADGSLGAANAVSVGNIEDKMGIHANPTCTMNYDGATGYLLGAPHKGLRAMFTMMNEARLAVGVQGLAQASGAHQNAVAYARERLQGRAVSGATNPNGPADPIIVHPDVRRVLMQGKSFVEAGRALTLWAAELIDRGERMDDGDARALVSLLIPVIKGVLTDLGFETAVQSQQVFGGHGYVEENGMSQFVRDARIAMIYEGANGIQALDLVGRKLPADGGKAMMGFIAQVQGFIAQNAGDDALNADFLAPLKRAVDDLAAAFGYLATAGMKDPDNALAGAYDFMHLFGDVALGLMWARMAKAALAGLNAAPNAEFDADFYRTKLTTGAYFMARHLPRTQALRARIETGGAPVMALAPEDF